MDEQFAQISVTDRGGLPGDFTWHGDPSLPVRIAPQFENLIPLLPPEWKIERMECEDPETGWAMVRRGDVEQPQATVAETAAGV